MATERKSLEQYLADMTKVAGADKGEAPATDLAFIDKLAAAVSDIAKETTTEGAEAAAGAAAAQTLENRPETVAAKAGIKVQPGNAGDELALQAMMEVIGPEGMPAGADLSQEVPVNAVAELPVVTDLDNFVKSPNDFSKSEAAAALELAGEAAKVAAATGDLDDGIDFISKHASAEYIPAIVETMGEILDGEKTAGATEVTPELVASAVEIIKNAGLADKVVELSKTGADCSDAELCKLAEDILNAEQGLIAGQQNIEKTAGEAQAFGKVVAQTFLSELKKHAEDEGKKKEGEENKKKEDEKKEGEEKLAGAVEAVKGLIALIKKGEIA